MNRQDLTLLTDLYELTMMQGYYAKGQMMGAITFNKGSFGNTTVPSGIA